MKKEIILTVFLAGLMFAAMSAAVYAQAGTVQIGVPSNPNDLGITSGSYWVGEFPVTINPGTSQSATGEAYCMTSGGTVYEGTSYPYSEVQVPNEPKWQQISYILSWNSPTTNSEAAIDQVAIWMLLGQNPPYTDFSLDSSITGPAATLVNEAKANGGMNVALKGDQLTWISPSTGTTVSTSAFPGNTVVFQAKLTDSSGNAKANVKIDFSATVTPPSSTTSTPLSSSYFVPATAFTDTNGIAQVTVTVPSNAAYGSKIAVTASTQSVWPVEYLDLTTATPTTQNLLGVGPALGLTATFNVYITGSIFVMPESAYGALAALVAFAAAFLIYAKSKRSINV